MKILRYRMYGAGLSNQRMSLDMGVALSVHTGRRFSPYGFRGLEHSGRFVGGQRGKYNVLDLFDVPLDVLDDNEFRGGDTGLDVASFSPDRLASNIFVEDDFDSDACFIEFLGGRKSLPINLNAEFGSVPILDFSSSNNFCNVAPQFYLGEQRRSEVVSAALDVVPKEIYRRVGREIAEILGSFNAVHIRQGDFLAMAHPFDIRDATELVDRALEIFDTNIPLVICSDQEDSPNLAPLLRVFPNHILLASAIESDVELKGIYAQLPFQDEAIMGLISQLVCEHAVTFAGSLRSTFTNYIHRARREVDMLFVNTLSLRHVRIIKGHFEDCFPDKSFTWERTGWRYDIDPSAITWMREWPESFH